MLSNGSDGFSSSDMRLQTTFPKDYSRLLEEKNGFFYLADFTNNDSYKAHICCDTKFVKSA